MAINPPEPIAGLLIFSPEIEGLKDHALFERFEQFEKLWLGACNHPYAEAHFSLALSPVARRLVEKLGISGGISEHLKAFRKHYIGKLDPRWVVERQRFEQTEPQGPDEEIADFISRLRYMAARFCYDDRAAIDKHVMDRVICTMRDRQLARRLAGIQATLEYNEFERLCGMPTFGERCVKREREWRHLCKTMAARARAMMQQKKYILDNAPPEQYHEYKKFLRKSLRRYRQYKN